MKINKVRITLAALAAEIHAQGQYLKRSFAREELTESGKNDPDEFSGSDVRLQVQGGSWQLHFGDSQYDQDHRGSWGCSSVPWGCTWQQARETARELLDDCANNSEDESAEG